MLMNEIVVFIWAILSHWGELSTGGIIVASVGVFERWRNRPIPWRLSVCLMAAFLLGAIFMAWQDEYRKNQGLAARTSQLDRTSQDKDRRIADLQSKLETLTLQATQTGHDAEHRREVRKDVGKFLAEGNTLRDKCTSGIFEPPCNSKWRNWKRNVELYLQANLDSSYADRFRSVEIPGAIPFQTISGEMAELNKILQDQKDR
jgi:hypothetical protein